MRPSLENEERLRKSDLPTMAEVSDMVGEALEDLNSAHQWGHNMRGFADFALYEGHVLAATRILRCFGKEVGRDD